ncbi:MAG: ATP-dependent Clp protease proteolytic subunit, partial [Parcubacteria group bacterium]|nr:ATP-dependent Clp protease proteolytic subunit [Parcubacteria group bacterium]
MATLIDAGVHYNIHRRIITLGEIIEPVTSTHFEHALGKILLTNAQKPIVVFLRGKKGGDLHACLKIYELIDACNTPIYTVAVDIVFSGFFYILQGGKKRFATPKTKLIFHRTTLNFFDIDINAENLHK